MSWLRRRLTKRRLTIVGILLAISVAAIALGDPLAHAEEGVNEDGTRGVAGMPRIVELTALVIAFVIAFPPRDGAEGDGDGDG